MNFGNLFESSARGKLWRIFVFIILLVIIALLINFPSSYNRGVDYLAAKTGNSIKLPKTKDIPFHLGLDLLGGTHLVYEAEMGEIPTEDRSSALNGVRDVIERRVNVFGVSEPLVQTNMSGSDYRIIVELAGVKDVGEAIEMIGETPLLEFKEQDAELRELSEEEKASLIKFNKKAEERAIDVLGKVLSGGDFAALAKEFSEDKGNSDNGGNFGWVTEEMDSQLVNIVRDFKIDETTKELMQMDNGYEIIKLLDKRLKTNPFDESQIEKEIKASHLLLCHNEIAGCEDGLSKDEAYKKIKEIKAEATPENFSQLVKKYSTEPGAEQSGGDLGWFNKTKMVKPFSDAVFAQEVGTISFVVETEFGYHLIHKEAERDIAEYNVSHIFIPTMSEKDVIGDELEWKLTELTGKNLARARVSFNPNDNSPEVSLEFDSEGADMFADITGRNVNKPVAIFLDGEPISIPTVNEKINGGRAVISGSFNINEAKLLAQRLNAGALPVPITLLSQQTVGASLGHISLAASLKAGLIGLIMVAVFMVLYYRLPGLFSVFSLGIYGLLVLALFKLWPVTLSLSGLAGFILSVGMAVDANVLIFERLKEELRAGKPISMAIRDAFERAWPSIRDGNASTIITCVILYIFTTSVVRGFAVTLGFGIIISMFSAIIVTRNFLYLFLTEKMSNISWLMGAKKPE